uniref:C-type lectin domain-containing protein n=1 Tax=Magallana gigas TaxID=29159 RepID=A0A8W8P056_MAGGI
MGSTSLVDSVHYLYGEYTWITQNLLNNVYCEKKYDCGTWTGGNDISVEDSFVWIGSNTPVTFTNWTGANPDDDMVTEDLRMFGNLLR